MSKKKDEKKPGKIKTVVLNRFDQLKLFLSLVKEWGWTLAIPDDEEGGDIAGLVVGQAPWVQSITDEITENLGLTFTLPDADENPSQTH